MDELQSLNIMRQSIQTSSGTNANMGKNATRGMRKPMGGSVTVRRDDVFLCSTYFLRVPESKLLGGGAHPPATHHPPPFAKKPVRTTSNPRERCHKTYLEKEIARDTAWLNVGRLLWSPAENLCKPLVYLRRAGQLSSVSLAYCDLH